MSSDYSKSYFLCASRAQKKKLDDKGIPYIVYTLEKAGILLDQDAINIIREQLNWVIESETPSIITGLFKIVVKSSRKRKPPVVIASPVAVEPVVIASPVAVEPVVIPSPVDAVYYSVNISHWNSDSHSDNYMNKWREALIPLCQIVEKNIDVSVPHHTTKSIPTTSDIFRIFIWSTPPVDVRINKQLSHGVPPNFMYGNPVACRDSAYEPSGLGFSVIDLSSDYCVAELFQNCLYIHHDLCHRGESSEIEILRHLVSSVSAMYRELFSATGGSKFILPYREIKSEKLTMYKNVLLEKLKPVLDKNIWILDNVEGKHDSMTKVIPDVNTFFLNIGLMVGNPTFLEQKERVIGGITISESNKILSGSGYGISIESDGVIIAELFENYICILIRDCSDKKLFEYVIDKLVEFFKLSDEEKSKIIAGGIERNTKITTDIFANNLLSNRDKILKESKKDLDLLKSEVVKYQQQLTKSIRELDTIVNIEKGLTNEEFSKRAIREYLSIQRNKNVKEVYFLNNNLTVYTHKIFCANNPHKKIYYIGEFKLILRTDKGDDVIRFHNLTQLINGYRLNQNAPHVFEDGHACLGNISNILPQLVGRGEYSTAISLAIEFLQAVNIDDEAGKHITNWPVVDQDTYETHMKNRGVNYSLPSITVLS